MLTALALLLAGVAPEDNALQAVAATSPRPAECAPQEGAAAELWSRVRASEATYCRRLARAQTRLARWPAEALELSRAAATLRPSARAPLVLQARALVRLGKPVEAWSVVAPLVQELGAGRFPSEDPASLRDVASAAVASQALAEAHELYRVLVGRAVLFDQASDRARALVEASAVALARGPEFIGEAELYLDEARRAGAPGVADLTLALRVLALDRAGRLEQARSLAREARDPWGLERHLTAAERALVSRLSLGTGAGDVQAGEESAEVPRYTFPSGELSAAIAAIASARDEKLSELHWKAFLADQRSAAGPWAEHARRKLAAAGRGAQRLRRGN